MWIIESAVLEIAWTAERKETIMVCKDGTKEEFELKREGKSESLEAVSSTDHALGVRYSLPGAHLGGQEDLTRCYANTMVG